MGPQRALQQDVVVCMADESKRGYRKRSDYRHAERLHILKTRLLSGHRLSIAKITSEFGVSSRTARRDIRAIELMGIDLDYADLESGERIWRAPANAREIKVSYTVMDVMSLFLGRRMFDFLEETSLADSFERVYGRIEEQLTEIELNKAKRLNKKIYIVHEGPKKLSEAGSEILDECLSGLLWEQKLRGVYRALNQEKKAHILHPYSLAAYKRGLYLVAHTERAGACTTFSLERFESLEWLRGESFTYPRRYDPERFFHSALFITPGEPEPVELAFSAGTEPFIRLRRFHETQQVETLPDGRIRMTLQVPVNFETVNWVLSFGAYVEVIRPAALRVRVVEQLRRAIGQYGEGSGAGE